MTTTIKLINILLTSYSYLCMCVRMCVCEYVCGENTCDLTTRYISATQLFSSIIWLRAAFNYTSKTSRHSLSKKLNPTN